MEAEKTIHPIHCKRLAAQNRSVKKKERFWEVDFLRGLCVLLMVFDHCMQLAELSQRPGLIQLAQNYLDSKIFEVGHPIIRAIFFILCGISCCLSRSNLSRGLKLGGVALGVTFFSHLLSTVEFIGFDMRILFGVLHMLAVAILLYSVLATFCAVIPYGKVIPMVIGFLMLATYYLFVQGRMGSEVLGQIPPLFGFRYGGDSLYSADWCPILPEAAYVLIGSGIGALVYQTKLKHVLQPLDGKWNKPVCFIGRHALIIYIVQPLAIGSIYLLL